MRQRNSQTRAALDGIEEAPLVSEPRSEASAVAEVKTVLSAADQDVAPGVVPGDTSSEEGEEDARTRGVVAESFLVSDVDEDSQLSVAKNEGPISMDVRKFEKNDYMSRRIMTAQQERWNGYSVLPSSMFCIWYCLSGAWLTWNIGRIDSSSFSPSSLNEAAQFCPTEVIPFFGVHFAPPLPMLAVAIGIVLHAPFSFFYHWHYCVVLPPGQARFDHWSRKLDQGFIHVTSAFLSYATSGSNNFLALNTLYNAHCLWRQLTAVTATPVQTQLRILLSMILYTCPIAYRGDIETFLWLWAVFVVSVYFFATYPIKGWSHCAFHMIVALAPPILMQSASNLEMSKELITQAAQCAVISGQYQS